MTRLRPVRRRMTTAARRARVLEFEIETLARQVFALAVAEGLPSPFPGVAGHGLPALREVAKRSIDAAALFVDEIEKWKGHNARLAENDTPEGRAQ